MYNLFFILLILVGCRDINFSGTAYETKEPDQKKLITFEHFKSDFDVYWDSEEKKASIAFLNQYLVKNKNKIYSIR